VGTPTLGGSESGHTDGRLKRKRHTAVPVSEPIEDGPILTVREQTLADADQTFADREQALADREQALADREQTLADVDQTASDGDQTASDTDQAASDLDLAQGGDEASHDVTRDIRARGTRQRSEAADERGEAAAARDAVAAARDRAAAARDQAAVVRDSELGIGEGTDDASAPTVSGHHHGDVADRVWAAEFRARAAADREQAAVDRRQAAGDRLAAETDREALLQRLVSAETDELTGARTRAAGLSDLEHEIDRARRGAGPLVTAYVDVVGLKSVNDTGVTPPATRCSGTPCTRSAITCAPTT
jgi:hypothetical protein